MSSTTDRRISDKEAPGEPRRRFSRWIAVFLAGVTVGAAFWLLGRDVGWENRCREAKLLAQTASENNDFSAAKRHYLVALANDPYDWGSHLALARIEYLRLNDFENAMRHYLYAQAYSPNAAAVNEAREVVETLKLIRLGELENPRDAVEDMFLTAEEGAKQLFTARLSPELAENADAYCRAWAGRGRGEFTYCRIRRGNDGYFDANVELQFPDETVMSMRFYCMKGNFWRLELSFP